MQVGDIMVENRPVIKPEHRECEVCHRIRDVWVCSSAFAAMSHAICRECLQKPAEPLFIFGFLLEDVANGDPANLDPSIRNWYTWDKDRYIHWDTFVHNHKEGKYASQNQASSSQDQAPES